MSGTARLLLGVALSAAFTACVVRHSERHMRLLLPPAYDDVSYFSDAAQRLAVLEEKNLGAFVKHSIASPPHSPLAAALGVAGFALFGLKDWAPYAANGVLVLALLAMVDHLFRRHSLLVRGAMAMFALALPWTSMLVYEFKPDPACALMVGFGVALAFEEDLIRATRRRRCAVGAAFGLAILFKPSFFVFAAALMAATFVGTLLIGPWRLREALKAWAWVAGATTLVGGLPLALRPRYYLHYLWLGLFLPPLPRHTGGWKEQALYYLTGIPDFLMRPEHLALLVGAFLAAAGALAYRGTWDRFRLVVAALVPVTVAYLLPTLSPIKNPDFGVMLATLLSFAVLRGLAETAGTFGTALALVATVLGLWWAKPPPVSGSGGSPFVKQQWQLVDEVYVAVRERLDRPGIRIFVTAPGTVSPDLLIFYSVRDGLPPPAAHSGGLGTPEETKGSLGWADLVIAPSPEAADVWPYTPRARVRLETLAALRADPSFSLFHTVRDGQGAPYYMFERIGAFHGFREAQGLYALEGPYPQWHLGLVRWGLGPETTLKVEAEETGRYRLSLDGRGAVPDLEVTLLLDGQRIAGHTFKDPSVFESVEMPLDLHAGEHSLRIVYSQWMAAPDGRKLAVLFNSLRVLPLSEQAQIPP
jgi:hypothetical protein